MAMAHLIRRPLFRIWLFAALGLAVAACGSESEAGAPGVDAAGAASDAGGTVQADPGPAADDVAVGADEGPPSDGGGGEDPGTEPPDEDIEESCPEDECEIDGVCWENEVANPENDCQLCLVVVSREEWSADDTASCDDGDACTMDDACFDGACLGVPAVACDDGNGCTDDSCDPATGACVAIANAAPCDDGDVCTSGEVCADAACQKGAPTLECDDGNSCTTDACDSKTGCVHTGLSGAPCSDGNECTEDDACLSGECSGAERDCDDSDVCTLDLCVPGLDCVYKSIAALCLDDNPCTDEDCDAELGCVYPFNTVPCSDGSACTAQDTCTGGACLGVPVLLDDSNPCTDDACDALAGVSHAPNTVGCDDGDACTVGDVCGAAVCHAGPDALPCDDGNPCTDNGCDPQSGCTADPNDDPCDDESVCTTVDTCAGGDCVGSAPVDCDDLNECTADSCHPVDGCAHKVVVSGACRPVFEDMYPPRGATIKGSAADPVVVVTGTVSSGGGAIVGLTVNGQATTVGEDGVFAVGVDAVVGGNTLVIVATDELGTTRKRVQAFLWSTQYYKPVESPSGMVNPGIGIWLSQEVLDDGDHSPPADDLATVFEQLLGSLKLGDSIPSPAYNGSTHKVFIKNVTHGAPKVSLTSQSGGLKMVVTISNVKGDVDADGKKIGCAFGICTYYPGASGDLKVSSVVVNANVVLSVVNHQLKATVQDVDVKVNGMKIDLDGIGGAIIQPIVDLLIDSFKSEIENQFESAVTDEIEPQLESALSSLAFDFGFDMPSLDPAGGSVPVQVKTDFSSVSFNSSGGKIRLRAGVYAPKVTPYGNLGVPGRIGCNAAAQKLVIPAAAPLELVLADDVTNELLYGGWRGGMLEFNVPPSMLADVNLADFGIEDLTVKVSGMLAPTLSDCNGEVLVTIGDLRIDAQLTLLGKLMNVVMFVTLDAGFEFTVSDGELGFAITEVKSLESDLEVQQDDLIGSEPIIATLVDQSLVPALLGALGGDTLAGVPLPKIDLGGGAAIQIAPQEVSRESGNTVVSGDLL